MANGVSVQLGGGSLNSGYLGIFLVDQGVGDGGPVMGNNCILYYATSSSAGNELFSKIEV
jgi:hypothetical protein